MILDHFTEFGSCPAEMSAAYIWILYFAKFKVSTHAPQSENCYLQQRICCVASCSGKNKLDEWCLHALPIEPIAGMSLRRFTINWCSHHFAVKNVVLIQKSSLVRGKLMGNLKPRIIKQIMRP